MAEEVYFHPFFCGDGDGRDQSSTTCPTPFVGLVTSLGVLPLDHMEPIKAVHWRYNKLDHLIKHTRKWTDEDGSDLRALLAVTSAAIKRSVNNVLHLSGDVTSLLDEEVAKETTRYSVVMKSIFIEIVVKVSPEAFDEFCERFEELQKAVKKAFAKKPPQAVSDPVELFNRAAEVKPLFDEVRSTSLRHWLNLARSGCLVRYS